jgi:hypothetical protein
VAVGFSVISRLLIMGKTKSQILGRGPEGTLSKCGYAPLRGCTEHITLRESSLVQVTGCTELKKNNWRGLLCTTDVLNQRPAAWSESDVRN